MYKTMKTVAFLIATLFTITLVSCMDDTEEPEVRTPEMEQAELQQIFDQIEENELVLDSTELGVYYLVDTLGTGPLAQPGDTCFIKYTGRYLDGTVFDDSRNHPENPEGVWKLIFKEIDLIPGFDDGIALMAKGTRLDLIIPSELAYGGYIPLIFSVEMVDIKPVIEP